MSKKLSVEKNEGIAEIVERILGEEEAELTLVVPKGAELGRSASNFHLLKREADAAGKNISIESVDDGILSLAQSSGIEASHSLFSAARRSSFSDIVPRAADGDATESASSPKRRKVKAEKTKPVLARAAKEEQKEASAAAPKPEPINFIPAAKEVQYGNQGDKIEPRLERAGFSRKMRLRMPGRRFAVFAVILAMLAFGAWVISGPFARATITINLEKTPWEQEGNFTADTSVSAADLEKNILPAQFFTTSKNLTHLAKASGVDEVSEKAKGKIWIYNAFNSSPQTLVANTRFEAPDGKIFKIVNQVNVPAAKVQNGKIIPSSIEADIVADKPGPEYNVGPIERLTIPGFKGSPRFEGFYGEIKEPTKGGFIGRKPIANADDVKKARERTEELLRSGVEMAFNSGLPKEFKILEGASKIELVRMSVNQETDADGNFSVFGEVKMSGLGFREADLKAALEAMAQNIKAGTTFKEIELSYSGIRPDFERKTLNFTLFSRATLWPKFSAEEFRKSVAGKSINEAQSYIAALPGFTGGRVAVWPIWLQSAPSNPEKIKVVVE